MKEEVMERFLDPISELEEPLNGQEQCEFEEVAVYFSREEWDCLMEEEKELYRDVMVENYCTLLSLGRVTVTPPVISLITRGEEPYVRGHWPTEETPSPRNTCPESPGDDVSSGSGGCHGHHGENGCGHYYEPPVDYSEEEEEEEDISNLSDGLEWIRKVYRPKPFAFTGEPGVKAEIYDGSDVYEIFRVFFTPHLLDLTVTETNRYASQMQSGTKCSWAAVTEDEMMCYVGLLMLMNVVRKSFVAAYWSTSPLISTPFFPLVMSRNRFMAIRQFLHFVDKTKHDPSDRLFKIRPVVEHLQSVFKSAFVPSQLVSLHENFLLWKGRVRRKRHFPYKNSRFGIKTFEVCDGQTGYLWNFMVYTGKTKTTPSSVGSSSDIALNLLDGLLHQGYCVITDNFYSSPSLFLQLIGSKTDAFGTMKSGRKDIPKKLRDRKLAKGKVVSMQSGRLTAFRWREKREVSMLSTLHDASFVGTGKINPETGRPLQKPKVIVDYNNAMGGVKDVQIIETRLSTRKSLTWYKKFFEHLLDVIVFNSFVVFKSLNKKSKMRLLEFRENLIVAIIKQHHVGTSSSRCSRVPGKGETPFRLTDRHFPSFIPPTKSRDNPRRQCKVCRDTIRQGKYIRKESRYMCRDCSVTLCAVPCFSRFHTLERYAHDDVIPDPSVFS